MFSFLLGTLLLLNVFAAPIHAEDTSDKFSQTREEAIKDRQEILQRLEARKAEVQEQRKEWREEFREKLSKIQDERKQRILQNLDDRIVLVNTKWVENWNNVLSRLSEIVAKIDERSEGKVSTVDAKAAISSAQSAVNAQSGKTYEIEIGEEETLGENVRETLSTFHKDLKAVQALIRTAREEVSEALESLKELNNDNE